MNLGFYKQPHPEVKIVSLPFLVDFQIPLLEVATPAIPGPSAAKEKKRKVNY